MLGLYGPIDHLLQTRWATHGKRLKGLKVAGSVERQTGGEKPFATRTAIFFLAPVNKMYAAMAAGAAAAPLPVCCPRSALCEPYVDPMLAHVGPMLA